jgi:hypothetical protein
MKAQKISREQLANVLWGINTPTFVGIEYRTVYLKGQKLYTSCPYDAITKTEKGVFLIGASYEKGIKNALKKRKDTTTPVNVQPRTWGTRLSNSLLSHKGGFYLTLRRLANSTRSQIFRANGNEIAPDIYHEYKYASKNEVYPNNLVMQQELKLDNILSITLRGIRYEIGA